LGNSGTKHTPNNPRSNQQAATSVPSPTFITRELGEGSEGVVFAGQYQNEQCAIKIIKNRGVELNENEWKMGQFIVTLQLDAKFKESFIPLYVQRKLNDPDFSYIIPKRKVNIDELQTESGNSISKFINTEDVEQVGFQMKLIRISLYEFINKYANTPDFSKVVAGIIKCLIFQMYNLHKNNIIHGDIKLENIGISIKHVNNTKSRRQSSATPTKLEAERKQILEMSETEKLSDQSKLIEESSQTSPTPNEFPKVNPEEVQPEKTQFPESKLQIENSVDFNFEADGEARLQTSLAVARSFMEVEPSTTKLKNMMVDPTAKQFTTSSATNHHTSLEGLENIEKNQACSTPTTAKHIDLRTKTTSNLHLRQLQYSNNGLFRWYLPNILDFGFSFIYQHGSKTTNDPKYINRGSWIYCPLESYITHKRVDFDMFRSKDIHGLGVIIYVLITHEIPFDNSITNETLAKDVIMSPEFYVKFQQKIIEKNNLHKVLDLNELGFIINFVNINYKMRCMAFDLFIQSILEKSTKNTPL
jgi:serine/threonine protein kinase